jgi:hypothetical protein
MVEAVEQPRAERRYLHDETNKRRRDANVPGRTAMTGDLRSI